MSLRSGKSAYSLANRGAGMSRDSQAALKVLRSKKPEQATKHDDEKPRMELLDPYAMEQLALVLTFGAKKYAPWNWTKGLAYGRLIGAALRHLFAFSKGEDLDPESGLSHLAHCMCCLMFLMGMTVRHPELDDREESNG